MVHGITAIDRLAGLGILNEQQRLAAGQWREDCRLRRPWEPRRRKVESTGAPRRPGGMLDGLAIGRAVDSYRLLARVGLAEVAIKVVIDDRLPDEDELNALERALSALAMCYGIELRVA